MAIGGITPKQKLALTAQFLLSGRMDSTGRGDTFHSSQFEEEEGVCKAQTEWTIGARP
jgi:hypothetical protein